MKQYIRTVMPIAVVVALGSTGGTAQAASYTRQNNVITLNLAGAWSAGGPPLAADAAQWNNTSAGNYTTALGASVNWGEIIIVNPGGAITIGNTGGATLTLNGLGGVGIDMSAATQNLTISDPVTLGGAQTWTVASSRTLTTGNGANLITNGGNPLTVDGAGTATFGVINNTAVVIAGSGALVKNGSGTLAMGGNNTGFSGNITVNGGVLLITNNMGGLGSGGLTLNGGVLEAYWGLTMTRTLGAGAGFIQITGGASGFSQNGANQTFTVTFNNLATYEAVWGSTDFNPSTLVFQSAASQGGANVTLSNKLDLNGTSRTISVFGGTVGTARATISGQIRNSTGTAGLTKTGAGALLLSNAANAWNGNTVINGGFVDLGGMTSANLGGGSGRNVTVAAGAGIRFNALSNAFLNRLVETSSEITVMTGATANNLDFGSSTGANLPNAFLGNWAGNGAKMEYSGTLTPASDNYRLGGKYSSGLLGIVGANKLTGSQGLLVGGTGATGIRVMLAAANDFTGDTAINTGAKLTLGNNLAIQNSVLDVGAAGGNFALNSAGTVTGASSSPSPSFGGLKGSRNLLSVFTNAGGNNESNLAATSVTGFTLNVGTGKTVTYSGAIAEFATGTTLTKTGLGTQILAGANTYTGATTVNGGTLKLGASNVFPNTSAVAIGAGTLDAATYTDTLGTLDVTGAAGINLGTGAALAFADSSAIDWTGGTLNLTGTFVSGSSLRFGTTSGGLTSAQLASISSSGFSSCGLNSNGYLIETTLPTLAPSDIVDNVGGGPVVAGTPVTYTVTFSEDLNASTVSDTDFGNAGTATISVGTVTETSVNSGVFTVPVTPVSGGTLQLQVNAGAELQDAAGNALDTTAAIADNTTITVTGGDTTPPTLAPGDIVDDKSGGPVGAGALVTYTVAFSEDMDAITVSAAAFGNAGTAAISVGTVNETAPDSGVFTVPVTLTSGGTLQLRVNAGAILQDVAGNALDTASAIADNTTLTVDGTPPTLAGSDIVDDKSGGPVAVGALVTYTVTFSEDMDASTVSAADFGNAGAAAISVGTVTETSANSGVFTVPVTPTSGGTVQLQVHAGAVLKDVLGNALDTTSAIADNTTLTVSILTLTWDANGGSAGQTDGGGAWLGLNQWWNGSANQNWPEWHNAVFGNGSAGGAVTLASPTTVGSLTLNTFITTGYTLGTAGQTITLNAGITKNAGGTAATIVSPITLGRAQTWVNDSSGLLKSSGGLDNNGNLLTIEGTGSTDFSGTANVITGAGGITKNGSGLLTLGAGGTTPAHNYTGPTVVNGGNVMFQNNKPAGNFTLGNGMLADYFQSTTTFSSGLGAGNNQIQIYGASGFGGGNGNSNWRIGAQNSVLTWGSTYFNPTTLKLRSTVDNNGPTTYGQVTLQNRLDLNSGARTIDVLLGGTNVGGSWGKIDDGIQDTGAAGSLIKTGGGILILGGTTSTWGGNTTVSGGILAFDGNSLSNIGGGSGRNISVAAGAGIRIGALVSAAPNRIVQTNDEISLIGVSGANNYDLSGTGANLPNAFLGFYSSNGGKCDYSGTITPASDNYRLGSPIGMNGLLGITSASVMSGTQGLIVGGGSVELVGAKTFSGDTSIRPGAKLGLAAVSGSGAVSYCLQNSVLDVGSAGGTFWLESAAGPDAPISGAVATTHVVLGGLKGSRNLVAVYSTTTGANNGKATAQAAVTGFTLNVGSGKTVSYSGAIADFATGTTLTKTGAGTQVLSGANAYTGATTINEGTLQTDTAGFNGSSGIVFGGGALKANTATGITTAKAITSSSAIVLNTANGSISLSGAIDGASGLTLAGGNNTLTITGGKAYSGAVTLDSGNTLAVDTLGDYNVNSGLGNNAANAAANLVIDGTLKYIGTGAQSTDRLWTLGSAATLSASGSASSDTINFSNPTAPSFVATGTHTLTLTGANTGANTLAAAVGDSTAATTLIKSGAGTWVLVGANSYTGSTTVNGGTLKVGANNVFPDASAVSIGAGTLDAASYTDTLGTLDVTGAAGINLETGAALAFADSSALDWAGGTLNLTGTFVSGSSLRFGTTSGGLTGAQLASISGPGFTSCALDANGYLIENTPPTLVPGDIVDDKGGGPVGVGSPVTYTVTFSEDMDAGTVTAADFGNAGTATFSIGTVSETAPDSGVFTVPVTATGGGTLRLKVNAGAELEDATGNALDTTAAIADNTTLTVDGTQPTLLPSDIVDDKSGEPVGAGALVTYTVTFSEDMDASTVSAADFGNAGAAAISVGTVTETSANSGVFTVPVTPTSGGTLQLRVNAGAALTDAVGNALDTTSAIADNTILTVDGTPPTLLPSDIVDDKSGGPVPAGTLVTYTVTFSEDLDASTVSAADFGNAGAAAISVGTVTETSPGVFSVPVTATGGGTLQLQVNAGAVLKDVFDNALDTTAAIADDTTLTVNILNLTWDANGGSAGQTDGGEAWLGANQWWNGSANQNWPEWNNAVFGNGNAGGAVTLASPTTVGSLTLNTFSGTYTLGTAGQTLTLNTGITKNAGGTAATIVSPVTLGGAQTWLNNSGGTLTTANGANLIANGGNPLTVDGTGNTTFGVINNATSSLTGSGALVKNGTGVLSLCGANAGFTGNVTVNDGILRVTSPTSLSGNLKLVNGVYEHYWSDAYTRTLGALAGQIQIIGGASGFSENGATGATFTLNNNAAFEVVWGSALFNPSIFVLQADTAQGSSSLTFANNVDLAGADRTIRVSGGTAGAARATLSGQIRNSTGTAGLTKTGAGVLLLSNAANAWNGSTVINGGFVDLGGMTTANLGGGSGRNVTVAAGAGVRCNALSNAFLSRLAETSAEITVMTAATANNLDFSSSTGANLPNAFLGNWASNGAKMEYSGVLTPASDNYRLGGKYSSGLLGIVGVNKLTGTQGLLVGGTGATGIRVELAAAQSFSGDTVVNTGARLSIGDNLALQNSVLDVGAAGGAFSLAAGTNAGRITGETAAPSPTLGGLAGSRNLISVFSTAAGNNETLLAATAVTGFTLNVGTGKTVTYSGSIGGFGPGGNSTLAKSGDGTQILSGASTYTGATTVNDGTLLVNSPGSLAAASTVTVGNTATLGGTGTLNGTVNVQSGGTLAPGASTGVLTAGNVTIASGGALAIEIAAAQTPKCDTLAVGGALDITGATLNLAFTGARTQFPYVIATYGSLDGRFGVVNGLPAGCAVDYGYNSGTAIAIVPPPTLFIVR